MLKKDSFGKDIWLAFGKIGIRRTFRRSANLGPIDWKCGTTNMERDGCRIWKETLKRRTPRRLEAEVV